MKKRDLADGISNGYIDEIYAAGRTAGAFGGKLLGAGGGGFMLFVVPPENKTKVREKLQRLVHVNFDFENNGSRVIAFDSDSV